MKLDINSLRKSSGRNDKTASLADYNALAYFIYVHDNVIYWLPREPLTKKIEWFNKHVAHRPLHAGTKPQVTLRRVHYRYFSLRLAFARLQKQGKLSEEQKQGMIRVQYASEQTVLGVDNLDAVLENL